MSLNLKKVRNLTFHQGQLNHAHIPGSVGGWPLLLGSQEQRSSWLMRGRVVWIKTIVIRENPQFSKLVCIQQSKLVAVFVFWQGFTSPHSIMMIKTIIIITKKKKKKKKKGKKGKSHVHTRSLQILWHISTSAYCGEDRWPWWRYLIFESPSSFCA